MPRNYYPQQERETPQQKRLANLASLAQIFAGVQGPQQREREAQQANSLQALGVFLQQQHQEAQLDLQRQGQQGEQDYRTEMLKNAQGAQEAENNRFLGTQTNEAARLALENQHYQNSFDAQQQQGDTALLMPMLTDPSIPLSQKQAVIARVNPRIAPGIVAMHQVALDKQVQDFAPNFGATYLANKNNPEKLHSALDALKATTPQNAFDNQDWGALNSSLPNTFGQPQQSFWNRHFGGNSQQTPQQNSPLSQVPALTFPPQTPDLMDEQNRQLALLLKAKNEEHNRKMDLMRSLSPTNP